MTTTSKRVGVLAFLAAAAVMTIGVSAFADGDGKKCGGGKNAEARFQKSDKNSDGFLTKAEVGDKRWERIAIADANKDAKVSLAEMKQAKADGKLKGKKKKESEA